MKALAAIGLGLLLVAKAPGATAIPAPRTANKPLARERRGGRAAIASIPGHLSSGQFNLVKTFMIEGFFAAEKEGICERQLDPCPPNTYASYDDGVLLRKCVSNCPAGFRDDGDFCWKPTTAWDWGFWSTSSCERRHNRGKCERCGWLIYKKCPAGYKRYGCNLCKKACPGGWDDWSLSCRKPIIDFMGKEDCANVLGLETTCGTAFCAKDHDACVNKGVSVGIDMLIMAASIWDLTGTSKAAVAASREAAKQAARAATKQELTTAAAKAVAKSATETIAWNIRVKIASDLAFDSAPSEQGRHMLNAAALAAGTAIALVVLAEETEDFIDLAMLIDPTGFASVVNGFMEKACPHLEPMECEPEPLWARSGWSGWSSECGDAKRTRAVTCTHGCEATTLSDSKCDATSKPDTEEKRSIAAYAPKWIYGEWRQQDPCGHTKKTRHAECHAVCADCTDEQPTEEYFDALCEENPDTYPDPNYAPNSGRYKHQGSNYACRCN